MSRGKCSPEQMAACPLRRHFTDEHHLMWPRRDYAKGVDHDFRELPQNKVQLCRNEHNEIHANEFPPKKPSRAEMLRAIAESALTGEDYGQTETEPAVHSGCLQTDPA